MDDLPLELIVERVDGALQLLSPAVGEFTCARREGDLLAAGSDAGALIVLGRARRLIVPEGIEGRVCNARPERVLAPIGFRALLYQLSPIEAGGAPVPADDPGEGELGLVFRAPQAGRFYHSPEPGEAAFIEPGSELEEGTPIGLIEVMKTFAVVTYRAAGGLPKRPRVRRMVAQDGTDVARGDPLIELE